MKKNITKAKSGKSTQKRLMSKTIKVGALDVLPMDKNFPTNPNIGTKFVDAFQLVTRNDDIMLMRFFSKIPGINLEEARFFAKGELLKRMTDVICSRTDYYPERPKK